MTYMHQVNTGISELWHAGHVVQCERRCLSFQLIQSALTACLLIPTRRWRQVKQASGGSPPGLPPKFGLLLDLIGILSRLIYLT